MAIQKKVVGTKVLFVDNANKLVFSAGEIKKARDRYQKELAKKLTKG